MSEKKILIAAGGTGGHMFPAQALANQLIAENVKISFLGAKLDTNKYFYRDRFSYRSISSSSLRSLYPKDLIHLFFSLAKGVFESLQCLQREKPNVVVGFGSFHTAPVLLAAKLKKIPIILFESNALPGKVNRFFSKISALCAVQFLCASQKLSGPVCQVSVPFFNEEKQGEISKQEALSRYELCEDAFTVLVFGGSQGAIKINTDVSEAIILQSQKHRRIQVIHLTGNQEQEISLREKYKSLKITAAVKAFENEMIFAWRCADLVICRSGAATIAEILHFEVPAILIPFPRSSENHQWINAKELEKIGGAVCVSENAISGLSLHGWMEQLTRDNLLIEMKEALKKFKASAKNESLKDVVLQFLMKEKK